MELYKALDKPRIVALDSLRGLAAGTVVIAHICGILIVGHSIDEYTPLYLLRAAHESVIFFFVLSGYVLTYQVKNKEYFVYKSFLMQRIFRIYIPYFVVMTFVFILYTLIQYGNYTQEQTMLSKSFPSSKDVLDHLLLVGNFNTNTFNNVIWSLVHEMRVALVFPILLFIITFRTTNVIVGLFLTSLLVGLAVAFDFDNSLGYKNSYLYTVHYFSFFALGGLLIKHSESLSKWFITLKNEMKNLLLILSLLVICYSRMLFLIPHKFGFLRISLFNEFMSDWITSLSASFLIVYAIHITNNNNFLLSKLSVFLGKISYSLYLLHLPLILVGLYVFTNTNRLMVIIGALFAGLILSFFLNIYVEKPSARLGKSFSE